MKQQYRGIIADIRFNLLLAQAVTCVRILISLLKVVLSAYWSFRTPLHETILKF